MNIRTTSGCGRIVKRTLADGTKSYSFSVVRNIRLHGRPSHIDLAKIGTFRESEFPERSEEFWSRVEKTLADLVKTNKLWNNDADKVRKQFSKIIPRTIAPAVAKTVDVTETNYEIMQSLISKIEGEKARRKLAESGISL